MNCFCGSAASYQQCCQPLHLNLRHAANPEQLMRSRYSAYVIGAYDYVLATYHRQKVQDPQQTLAEIRQFGEQTRFLKLTVLSSAKEDLLAYARHQWPILPMTSTDATLGYVHFQAILLEADRAGTLDEISRFVHENGRWYYFDGILQPYRASKIGRNDACPCGSGKKFKQCGPSH